MENIPRNRLCPCGSGKKYKRCCIDKVILFSNSNDSKNEELKTSQEFTEEIKQYLANTQFSSLSEVNNELAVIVNNYNSAPKKQFLGLSPIQISTVLRCPFSLDNQIFKFEISSEKFLLEVPILKQSLFLLKRLLDVGELRSTQKGNLPRALVVEFYEKFISKEGHSVRPNREDDLPSLVRLKNILTISGLIKKRNNKYSLTKKGTFLIKDNKVIELFEIILANFAEKWNWGYSDRYPDLYFIQRSIIFNFFILHKKAQGWVLDQDLGKFFLEAFPDLINEFPSSYFTAPEDGVVRCFSLRFLHRFCLPLGLVEFKEEKILNEKYYDYNNYYRSTVFFKTCFKFYSNEKQ